jgi:hypothetical protein
MSGTWIERFVSTLANLSKTSMTASQPGSSLELQYSASTLWQSSEPMSSWQAATVHGPSLPSVVSHFARNATRASFVVTPDPVSTQTS